MPGLGRGVAVGLGEESTPLSAEARSVWSEVISVSDAIPMYEKKRRRFLAGTNRVAGQRAHAVGMKRVRFTITFEWRYTAGFCRMMLYGALGAVAESGAGPYVHTKTRATGGYLPTFTVEVIHKEDESGNARSQVYTGCQVESWETVIVPNGDVSVTTVTLVGCDAAADGAAGTPTYPDLETEVMYHHAGAISWNSRTVTATELRLRIANDLQERPAVGSQTSLRHAYRDAVFSVQAKVEDDENSIRADYESDAAATWGITFSDTHTIAFSFHNAYISTYREQVGDAGVKYRDITWTAEPDADDTNKGLTVVWTDDEDAYDNNG